MYIKKQLPTDDLNVETLGKHAHFINSANIIIIALKILTVLIASYSFVLIVNNYIHIKEYSFYWFVVLLFGGIILWFFSNFYTSNIKMATNQFYDKIDNKLQSPYLYLIMSICALSVLFFMDYYSSKNMFVHYLEAKYQTKKDSSRDITQLIILKTLEADKNLINAKNDAINEKNNSILKRNGNDIYKLQMIAKNKAKLAKSIEQTQIQTSETVKQLLIEQQRNDSVIHNVNNETLRKRNETEKQSSVMLFWFNLTLNILLGGIVFLKVKIETLCGVTYFVKASSDRNVVENFFYTLNAIFVKNVNNAMNRLYNMLTPNTVVELKDIKNANLTLNANRNSVSSDNNVIDKHTINGNPESDNVSISSATPKYNVSNLSNLTYAQPNILINTPPSRVPDAIRVKNPNSKLCDYCGAEFMPQRKTAKFCSQTCRVKNHKEK